jgi:hypothetical protein
MYVHAGNPDPTYYRATNSITELVRLDDKLNMTVPAGYYASGVEVQVSGDVSIEASASGGDGSAWLPTADTSFTAALGPDMMTEDPPQIVSGDPAVSVSYPFTLTYKFVPDGSNYTADQTIAVNIYAVLDASAGTPSSSGAWGSATVDISGGFNDITVSDSRVTWESDSGVFLSQANHSSSIPTVSQWGMITLLMLMLISARCVMHRQRRSR